MVTINLKNIQIVPFGVKHVPLLAHVVQHKYYNESKFNFIQPFIKNTIKNLTYFKHKIKPRTYIAIENNRIIAFLYLNSSNLKSTALLINEPFLINDPLDVSSKQLKEQLLTKAISDYSGFTLSWFIKADKKDLDFISLCRELGFQPLKHYLRWDLSQTCDSNNVYNIYKDLSDEYLWERFNKANVHDVMRIDQLTDSTHLKQLKDLNSYDYLSTKSNPSGILQFVSTKQKIAIAALIKDISVQGKNILRLVRDHSFNLDSYNYIHHLLSFASNYSQHIELETLETDNILNSLIDKAGYNKLNEQILLGKTSWKRIENRLQVNTNTSLDSVLNTLNPNFPPIPNPISIK